MELESRVRRAVYRHFARTGGRPSPEEIAEGLGERPKEVLAAFRHLAGERALVLEEDRRSIRMALPFSGVPTQHRVEAGGIRYFANCAWDALGIPAALRKHAVVHSRCEHSRAPLRLPISLDGPEPSPWLYHSLVPAAKWWEDIVFT